MDQILDWLGHAQWPLTVAIGSATWLIAKAWDLQSARRSSYADVARAIVEIDRAEVREGLILDLAKLWIEAPTPVALCAERLRVSLKAEASSVEAAGRALVIAMRRDTTLWAWADPRRWRKLNTSDIHISTA